jgi:hypothetical protein
MIEFNLGGVGFKVDKVEDLRRLVEQRLLDQVINILYSTYVQHVRELKSKFLEKNLGFATNEGETEEESDDQLDINSMFEGLEFFEDDDYSEDDYDNDDEDDE